MGCLGDIGAGTKSSVIQDEDAKDIHNPPSPESFNSVLQKQTHLNH